MKLKAIQVKEFHGAEFYFRLEYTGGCKITIGFSSNNSTLPLYYIVLEYFPLKYTTVLCLQYFDVANEAESLVGCIDTNAPLEEIKMWFIDGLDRAFYGKDIKKIINNVDLQKYLKELEQCYQEIRPCIEKEQEKEDEKVREYNEIEELIRGSGNEESL
jgi:hypothetical protein